MQEIKPATRAEGKGGPDAAAALAEDVFLSPRVVDEAALREFGEALRSLLEEAARGRESLREAVERSEGVVGRLSETANEAAGRLRPATKLVGAIEQRVREAEEALSKAGDASRVASQAAAEAERVAGEAARAATAESMQALREARTSLEEAAARAGKIESRLGQAAERAEMAVEALERECRSRLEAAAGHAQDVLGTMVAEVDARAEEAIERLTALLEERRQAAEAAVGGAIEVDGPGQDSGNGGAEARTDRASEAAQEALRRAEEAERRAAEAEARLDAATERLEAIDRRGREIAEGASQALAMFDQELSGRMRAVREMMEQLARVSGEPGPQTGVRPGAGLAGADQCGVVQPGGSQPGGEGRRFIRVDRPNG